MSGPTAAETATAELRAGVEALDVEVPASSDEASAAPAGAAPSRAVEAVALPVAVLGAGVVAQAIGLAARLAAEAGTPMHDGGGALVAAGWVVVFGALLWLLRCPVVTGVAVAAVVALGAGVALGRSGANDPGADGTVTPTGAPAAVTIPVPGTTPETAPPGSTTTIDPSTPTTRSIGQMLADQGAGWNTPPPSIPGVSFPVEGGRVDQPGPAPWADGAAPVVPITAPTEPLASTTTAATAPTAEPPAEPTSTSGAGS